MRVVHCVKCAPPTSLPTSPSLSSGRRAHGWLARGNNGHRYTLSGSGQRPPLQDSSIQRLSEQRSLCKASPLSLVGAYKFDCCACEMADTPSFTPLNHEEIHSIIHQPADGYFSNAEDDMLSEANRAPYYYHNGMNIEWPQWDVGTTGGGGSGAPTTWTCKGTLTGAFRATRWTRR